MDLPGPWTRNDEEAATKMWKITTSPRGRVPDPFDGQTYSPHPYGFVGVSMFFPDPALVGGKRHALGEGMNEHGLAIAAQVHNGAQYEARAPPPDRGPEKTVVAYDSVIDVLLGTCRTVAEVTNALENALLVVLDPKVYAFMGRKCHWHVADATGAEVVVEYVRGELRVHDSKRIGVMTNDPEWTWHVTNLNQYATYPLNRTTPPSWPEGPPSGSPALNTKLLPGGFAPADRFARLFLLRESAVHNAPPQTVDDAIVVAQGLINSVSVIQGVTNEKHGGPEAGKGQMNYTPWAVVKIPSQRRFLIRTYSNQGWRELDLKVLGTIPYETAVPLWNGLGIEPFLVPPPAEAEL